jgi:hypothetical protein
MYGPIIAATRTSHCRRIALLAAPAAVLGLVAPVLAGGWAGLDPRWSGRNDRQGGGIRIVLGTGPLPIGRTTPACRPTPVRKPIVREVMPCDLSVTAYQSGGTVIVVAAGTNRTGGFTTTLAICGVRSGAPEVILSNSIRTDQCATQAITPFNVHGSFTTRHRLCSLKVKVAGECLTIPVTQVACLQ